MGEKETNVSKFDGALRWVFRENTVYIQFHVHIKVKKYTVNNKISAMIMSW